MTGPESAARGGGQASAWQRVALLAASLMVALLIGEALLQLGALGIRLARRGPDDASADRPRVVCLGDSNTYGLYLEPEQAWPRLLERRWREGRPGRAVEVLNLGYPGTNSSTVLRELPKILTSIRPEAVVVLVGANDFWTIEASTRSDRGWLARVADGVRQHSRLYRIVSMLRARGPGHGVVVPEVVPDPSVERRTGTVRVGDEHFELGFAGRKSKTPADETALAENLHALISLAQAEETPLVLATYAWDGGLYGSANAVIRQVAATRDVPLVDLAAGFSGLCPDERCAELFFADRHPTAAGHVRIAELFARHLPTPASSRPPGRAQLSP